MASAARLPYPVVPNDQGGFDILLQAPSGPAKPADVVGIPGGGTAQQVVTMPEGEDAPPMAAPAEARMPRPRPAYDEAMPAGEDEPPQMSAPREGGILSRLGVPEGVRGYLSDVAGGVNSFDPDAGPLMQLAQGFSGSMRAGNIREERKRAELAAAEETQYQRGRDAEADARATAQDEREGRRLSLEERKATYDEGRARAEERRKARAADWDEVETAAGIEHTQAETEKIKREYGASGLTPELIQDIEQDTINYMESLGGDTMRDTDRDRIIREGNTYRTRRIEDAKRLMGGGGGGAPQQGGAPPPAKSGRGGAGRGGTAVAGAGTQDAPVTWNGSPASIEEAKAELDRRVKANGGKTIYFRNPADGRVLPYP